MEVRFPTYSLRDVQRSAQRPDESDDAFVHVIGNLTADTERDLSRRSTQAKTTGDQAGDATSGHRAQSPSPLGAEAITAAISSPPEEVPQMYLLPLVGKTLDVLA